MRIHNLAAGPLHRLAVCLLLTVVSWIPLQAGAAGENADMPPRTALDRIEGRLAAPERLKDPDLDSLEDEIARVRDELLQCVEDAEQAIASLDSELAILRPERPVDPQAPEGEAAEPQAPVSPEIAGQIDDLSRRKAAEEARLANCRLMLLRSDELRSTIDEIQREARTRRLLVRGPGLLDVVEASLEDPERWLRLTTQLAVRSSGWDAVRPLHLGLAAAVGIVAFVVARVVAGRLRRRLLRMQEADEGVSAGLVHAGIACATAYAPWVLALFGVGAYLALVPRSEAALPFVVYLSWGLAAYFFVAASLRTLLNPCPPAVYSLGLAPAVARALSRRSRVLALVMLVWWLIEKLNTDGLLDETVFALAGHVIAVVWVLNVIWVIWLLRRIEGWRGKWTVPVLLSLALFAGLLAGWIGYVNLGALVIQGITLTLVLLGLALVLNQFLADLLDGLDEGRYRWQRLLRGSIGLKDGEYVPGLGWLKLLIGLLVWITAALLVLRTWGAGELTSALLRYFREGFQVAGLQIVPGQLLWAILALGLLLTLTRWLKARLDSRWLAQTRMERSSREALVTTFGYVAVALSIIVALSIAGIEFTNLAIIAGALSVGIGFGLQNVVNNFVSGIIMLVERPVRTGDWIVVGSTEGYVQRISIRSTTIRTFDRAEVIVPNSDLISGQVTNLTLANTWGRIKVPIGVAYGSDTAKVRELLLDIASDNEEVVKGNRELPDPYVLFTAFGDSSLNLELRAIIRDVDRRVRVISEINFAIDAAFREHGIEIPFPQRDLNFRGPLQIERGSLDPEG